MKEAGIQTSVHYLPVHLFSNFAGRFSADVPRVEQLAGRLLTLPLHPLMTNADVATVCDALTACVAAASRTVAH
jgi:dTDP-4-amino-4,6-dideoxygalactose transaminase